MSPTITMDVATGAAEAVSGMSVVLGVRSLGMGVAAGVLTAPRLTVPRLASTRIYVPRIERATLDSGAVFGESANEYGYAMMALNPNQSTIVGGGDIQVRLDADLATGTVDFGVNFAGLFVRNPAIATAQGTVLAVSSDNASGYGSGLIERGSYDFDDNDADQGLFLATFPATTDQYWSLALELSTSSLSIDVAMALIGTYFEIHAAPVYGYQLGDNFPVIQQDMGFGREFSRLGISAPRWETVRMYTGLTAAQFAELKGAWEAAYGMHAPVILCDDFDPDQLCLLPRFGRIVRFTQFAASRAETPDERWNVQVGFREMAIIPFGRSY